MLERTFAALRAARGSIAIVWHEGNERRGASAGIVARGNALVDASFGSHELTDLSPEELDDRLSSLIWQSSKPTPQETA